MLCSRYQKGQCHKCRFYTSINIEKIKTIGITLIIKCSTYRAQSSSCNSLLIEARFGNWSNARRAILNSPKPRPVSDVNLTKHVCTHTDE